MPSSGEWIALDGGLDVVADDATAPTRPGLAEVRGSSQDSFWTWRETMYRFVDRLRPDEVAAIAAMAFAEMLEGGFTSVAEFHYLHHDVDGRPYANPGDGRGRRGGGGADGEPYRHGLLSRKIRASTQQTTRRWNGRHLGRFSLWNACTWPVDDRSHWKSG